MRCKIDYVRVHQCLQNNGLLLVNIFSITDGDDGDDRSSIQDLIDNAVVTDAYAIGVTSF